MSVTQWFTIEIPGGLPSKNGHDFQLTREEAESLHDELGEALYPGNQYPSVWQMEGEGPEWAPPLEGQPAIYDPGDTLTVADAERKLAAQQVVQSRDPVPKTSGGSNIGQGRI